jgi:hypothetical protein
MRQKSILFSSRVKTFQAGIYNAGINSVFKGTKAQSASLHGAPRACPRSRITAPNTLLTQKVWPPIRAYVLAFSHVSTGYLLLRKVNYTCWQLWSSKKIRSY